MTKREVQHRVKGAKKVLATLKGAMICYNIYSDATYVLDTEEDNVIDIARTEQEAIEICEGINSGEFSGGIKSKCYYKPIIIDADSGERVTRQNIHLYQKQKP